ncbi:pseudaminic acid synthase [Patescibacteria group bacterium]|nr:pseudaminic acid synthase [Patescibacteria group bacterium]MBU1722107.1 pseudaminic acid synthase [Patescibacteria group bacterium]MBU1901597.1 pseudaminic acid synthase [Patescibacteria group bacterium]
MNSIKIQTPKGDRYIGEGHPVFVIAELSGNHNHDINKAFALIDAAADAGADAVKLQTYTPDTLTIDCDNDYFQVKVNDAWAGKTLYELYKTAYTPWEWHEELKAYGEEKGLIVFSTPFDETAVDFLEELGVELYKVASFETGDLELLKKIGSTKKPVIMSRGLTSEPEIQRAIDTLKSSGCPEVIVLHCISSYPANLEQMNVATVADIPKRFNVISGLSDHSLGLVAATAAVANGAAVLEKHITLDRSAGGPDAAFSLEPDELKALVDTVQDVSKAMGTVSYEIGEKEKENLVFRRSIFVVKDIKQGEPITREHVRVIRPGYGLDPKELPSILGKIVTQDLERGTPLSLDHVEK